MNISGTSGSFKIISGGQTGVDRAALDAALDNNIPCSGWCPRGRRAEDGTIPSRYPLKETPGYGYSDRTRRNILAADGTLILNMGEISGGTKYTLKILKKTASKTDARRPSLLIKLDGLWASPGQAIQWIRENAITTLNVAGPREEKYPGAHKTAYDFMTKLFQGLAENPPR